MTMIFYMKKNFFKAFELLILCATVLCSCDDDGITEGDPNYWTSSRGQFISILKDGTKMFFLDSKNGTATVTFDGSNPLHWQDASTATVKVSTYKGDVNVPEFIENDGKQLTVTSIGEEAFMGCRTMTACVLPETVTSIGQGAFNICTTLTSVNIPKGVTEIPSACFGRCEKLTSINIPVSVTNLGRMAFYGCIALRFITVNATEPPIIADETVFSSISSSAEVKVPTGCSETYKNAPIWKNMNIVE